MRVGNVCRIIIPIFHVWKLNLGSDVDVHHRPGFKPWSSDFLNSDFLSLNLPLVAKDDNL